MMATLTQVVKQFQQDWTGQLEPDAILTACCGVAYRWRERTLDPVTTIPDSTVFIRKCRFRLFSCGGVQAPPAWTIFSGKNSSH